MGFDQPCCSVSDRLFPVELTEIADWKSMSEYMLHSNFGKALTGVIGGKFGAYTFILPLPCLLNICLSSWMFYRRKEYLNKIKNTSEFPQINSCCFRQQAHSSSSVRVQSVKYRLLKMGLNDWLVGCWLFWV